MAVGAELPGMKNVAIVGAGLIGASFGLALRKAGFDGAIVGVSSESAIDEAIAAREEGKPRVILFCLSGHGNFDLSSYDAYLTGKLKDYEYPSEAIGSAMRELPVT